MKPYIVLCALSLLLTALIAGPAFAQNAEESLTQAFHRGDTYIRYHLAPEALESQNESETTFTLTHRTIDTIDAYFECIPGIFPNEPVAEPQRFEVQWNPVVPGQRYYVLPSSSSALNSSPFLTSWNIGNLALGLGYNAYSLAPIAPEQQIIQPESQAVAGQLLLPLGETGFSLGASVVMQAAHTPRQAYSDVSLRPGQSGLSFTAEIPATLGYATTAGSASDSMMPADSGTEHSPVSLLTTRNTVAGAVNVSGFVKGFKVFTEVGFAAGTQEYEGAVSTRDATTSNFYASGGADYSVGQVTLGFEAGFENGEELVESGESLGFENDFFIEDLLPDMQSQPSTDRVYASVSAKLSPTERMMIEGAFKYIQPLQEPAEAYGFEVDGAFYYSLTNYLSYLVKAGMSTIYNSIEDYQYRVTNEVELTF
jgi:hypothetical protein